MDELDRSGEAVRRDDSPDTRATLLAALSRNPALVRIVPAFDLLGTSADGTRLFINDDGPRAIDTTTFDPIGDENEDAFDQLLAEPGRMVFGADNAVFVETRDGDLRSVRPRGMRASKARRSETRRSAWRTPPGAGTEIQVLAQSRTSMQPVGRAAEN